MQCIALRAFTTLAEWCSLRVILESIQIPSHRGSKIGCLVRRRVANHHYGSVNTSTTNALIKNQTKGDDSLSCNLSSANRIKKT